VPRRGGVTVESLPHETIPADIILCEPKTSTPNKMAGFRRKSRPENRPGKPDA
jgi:hypothetical protein